MSQNKKDFEIGLVLAGAVSAGAYTAGVMDFLLDALDKWNAAKNAGADVPRHNVKIKVISGASAGGMTAAMAAVEIRRRSTGQKFNDQQHNTQSLFYRAWVDMIDIKSLLSCSDLEEKSNDKKPEGNKPIMSLLNSSVIENIANEIITIENGSWTQLPYVVDDLKVYLSLSNLRGIPFKFDLSGESGFPYEMTSHADYQFVHICEKTSEKEWQKLKSAAVATGAFPIGLSARIIKRSKSEYEERLKHDGIDISKLLDLGEEASFDFVAVDGGLLNNEPLELAKAALYAHEPDMIDHETKNKEIVKIISEQKGPEKKDALVNDARLKQLKEEKGRSMANAIVMVDPFPNINPVTEKPEPGDASLFNIIVPVLSAMRSQCLFKPEELVQSTSDDIFDRFLIAPIRHRKSDEKVVEKNPLASGFFGGFGGFMSHDFRKHDYYLGRKNCQQFLKYYFSIPKAYIQGNPIFEGADFDKFSVDLPHIKGDTQGTKGEKRYPLIPLVDDLGKPEPTVDWPIYKLDEFNTFKNLLAKRIIGLFTKAMPLAGLKNYARWGLVVSIILISLVHFHQYSDCGNWIETCDIPFLYIKSFGMGLLEFMLIAFAATCLIFLLSLHVAGVWVNSKLISLIERYLKDYNIDIK